MRTYPASILWMSLAVLPCHASPELQLMRGMEIGDQLNQPENLANWLISEKFDGIRAYWDGTRLLTRNGYPIDVPSGFTRGWPERPLEGELWVGYGQFARLSGLVQRHQTRPEEWQDVRYLLFDLPDWPGTFVQRQAQLNQLITQHQAPNLRVIRQHTGMDEAQMQALLDEVIKRGGEGLMLHRSSALYQLRRTADIRKLKPFQDAEARVLEHLPGRGKYSGLMGSLLVEMDDGTRLRIGTGFSDAERADPPPPGSLITFRYNGLTRHGLPRFARFLRIRPD